MDVPQQLRQVPQIVLYLRGFNIKFPQMAKKLKPKSAKFERCIMDVMKTGKSKSSAYGICNVSVRGAKSGGKKK